MSLEDEIKQKQFSSIYQKLGLNILFTSSWLQTIQQRLFKPYGITTQQYNVLRILRGQHPNPASVGLIQERMLDRSSNASRLVDKLVDKKLVERNTCPKDRRQVDILISPAGLKLLSELDGVIAQHEETFRVLTEEEARTVSDLLDKFRKQH
ncbi:MAG TPA: MarR family transcriptional regulator [Bacteroidia bacterium]|nr:MarR family transcriptional regulator [Bacteroidia bacterium]